MMMMIVGWSEGPVWAVRPVNKNIKIKEQLSGLASNLKAHTLALPARRKWARMYVSGRLSQLSIPATIAAKLHS
ncbi:hypothetical protein RJZ57_002329 [Blastomyces gilchristii]